MKKIFKIIDSINEFIGSNSYWVPAALIVIVVTDVVGRYFFRHQTVWGFETALMLGGMIIILPWGWNELHKQNIRVDVIYIHLSHGKRKLIDIIGNLLFTLPMFIILVPVAFSFMIRSWTVQEVMKHTIWYPPAAPFRTMVFIALTMAATQYMVTLIRDIKMLRKKETGND